MAVTSEGRKHLGAAIGKETFVEKYVQQKVSMWTHEVEYLASIAITQPHAAYAAFIRGLSNKWWYLARTLPGITDLYLPLEQAIRQTFLPSLTGQSPFSDAARDLMALPTRLGGLGIVDPSKQTAVLLKMSEELSEPLVALILQQSQDYSLESKQEQITAKNRAKNARRQQEQVTADLLKSQLPTHLQRALAVSSEKGASSWLSVPPIAEHGFALHKGAFQDALCLRYGWHPSNLPAHCVCGK